MNRNINISPAFSYMPLEETLEIIPRKKELFIGIPKETTFQENRVPLTPDAVSVLVNNGHKVLVEHNAGFHSHYLDKEFSDAGAIISYERKDVYQADVIIKSAPISEEEVELLQPNQVVLSPVHLPMLKASMVEKLLRKKIIAVAFDSIKDDSGTYPIVRSMSEIAGSSAILTAANYLGSKNNGMGVLLGGISGVPPARVVIIGAGVVGEFATRTAMGLGASVKVFDNSIYRLMRLQNNVGVRIFTSVLDPNELATELKNADVAVGAMKPINGVTPIVVTEEMVSRMKPGSVIVDVSIDRGGCFETSEATSHDNPVFKKYEVVHYCVPNIASGVSKTASRAISNVLLPIVLEIAEKGGIDKLLFSKPLVRNGVYIYKGCVTNLGVAKKLGMNFTNLDLLLANPL